jgi:hypothetical protein
MLGSETSTRFREFEAKEKKRDALIDEAMNLFQQQLKCSFFNESLYTQCREKISAVMNINEKLDEEYEELNKGVQATN